MNPFIRSDQYHAIEKETQKLIHAYASVNDVSVLSALNEMAVEAITQLFGELTEAQSAIFRAIKQVKNKEEAEAFLLPLKEYVIAFKPVTEEKLKKLFPKSKKLKVPALNDVDLKDISYLSWIDHQTTKKYLVAELDDRLIGITGSFTPTNQKGICTICNQIKEVGLFLTKIKATTQEIKRGNYICQDSVTCNQHITSLEKLHHFLNHLTRD